jgi:hypothetical protein
MTESMIVCTPTGTTFAGPDATSLYRVMILESSLRLWLKTGLIPTKGFTIMKMLALAETYTAKHYKRGQAELAAYDLRVWIDAMKSAMPIEVKS